MTFFVIQGAHNIRVCQLQRIIIKLFEFTDNKSIYRAVFMTDVLILLDALV
jgi:hypothetical protein